MVTTAIFPLFYKNVMAVLATVLGPLADYEGRKKRFFAAFFGLGVAATCILAFRSRGPRTGGAGGLSAIGFAAANVFYDSFLTERHHPGAHGPPVGGWLCLGVRRIDGVGDGDQARHRLRHRSRAIRSDAAGDVAGRTARGVSVRAHLRAPGGPALIARFRGACALPSAASNAAGSTT